MSQLSACSSISTIPPDLIENQNDEFFEEISEVNDLFFGNVLVTGDTRCEIDTDTHGESDNDSESEGNLEFNVDDARQTDVTEHNLTSQFRRKTCGHNDVNTYKKKHKVKEKERERPRQEYYFRAYGNKYGPLLPGRLPIKSTELSFYHQTSQKKMFIMITLLLQRKFTQERYHGQI
ncbi:hypothetical protein KUTeg_020087 [Tegillarca granosa]|uniref:Uncharacterized protein n=1 Tax=Tegillarca granosa TaxID=220873 RepID=A0ABQ9E7G9_TEGGR|nr:hypothetical protein KUTeg_020087 [Tegillarca granosa]